MTPSDRPPRPSSKCRTGGDLGLRRWVRRVALNVRCPGCSGHPQCVPFPGTSGAALFLGQNLTIDIDRPDHEGATFDEVCCGRRPSPWTPRVADWLITLAFDRCPANLPR